MYAEITGERKQSGICLNKRKMNDNNFNSEERIRKFLKNEMSSEEAKNFKGDLDNDEQLRNNLQSFQDRSFVFEHQELFAISKQIKESVQGIELEPDGNFEWPGEKRKEIVENPSPKLLHGWPAWGLGVLLLLLGAASIYFLGIKKDANLQYQTYAQPMEVLLVLDEDDPLTAGMQAYSSGDFQQSASLLESQLSTQANPFAQIYLGISYLLNGQAERAIPTLEEIQSIPPLHSAANWYLALALLEVGRENEAIPLLEESAKSGNYADLAGQLLQDLNN